MGKFFSNPLLCEFEENEITKLRLLEDFLYQTNDGDIITVPKGFISDGASIPQCFWSFFKSATSFDNLRCGLIHDWLCYSGQKNRDEGIKPRYNWKETHMIFKDALKDSDVSYFKREQMYWAVYLNWLCNPKLKF